MSTIICPNCGGKNEISTDVPGECAFCGSALSIEPPVQHNDPYKKNKQKSNKVAYFYNCPLYDVESRATAGLAQRATFAGREFSDELYSVLMKILTIECSSVTYYPYYLYKGTYSGHWTNKGITGSNINGSINYILPAYKSNESNEDDYSEVFLNINTAFLSTKQSNKFRYKKYKPYVNPNDSYVLNLQRFAQNKFLKRKAYCIENPNGSLSFNEDKQLQPYSVYGEFSYDDPVLVYLPRVEIVVRKDNTVIKTCHFKLNYSYRLDHLYFFYRNLGGWLRRGS